LLAEVDLARNGRYREVEKRANNNIPSFEIAQIGK
jgi:hypothetical protein